MKSVLITGACGFIGGKLARYFYEKSIKVIGIGHGEIDAKDIEKHGLSSWYETDITFLSLEKVNEPYDTIIHCAGSSSVGKSEKNPRDSFLKTVLSTQELLEYVTGKDTSPNIIYISSAAVYGDTGKIAINETDQRKPVSVYGVHKAICEELCEYYRDYHDLKIDIIRPFSIMGEGIEKQLLWDACTKFQNNISEFWGTGNEIRDWVHIDDLVSLIYQCANADGRNIVVNASTGKGIKNCEFLQCLQDEFFKNKNKLQLYFNDKKLKSDPENLLGSNDLAMNKLGWQAEVGYQEAITRYVKWYKNKLKK